MNFRRLWISPVVAVTLCIAARFAAGADDAAPQAPLSITPAQGPAVSGTPLSTAPTSTSGPELPVSTESNSAPAAPAAAPAAAASTVTPSSTAEKPATSSPTANGETQQPKQLETVKTIDAKDAASKAPNDSKPLIKPGEKSSETPAAKPVIVPEKKPEAAKPVEKVIRKPVTTIVKPRDPLLDLVDRAILETSRRRLTAGVHTPWQIVHGILAYRWDFKLINPLDTKDISAIEWMFSGQYFDNEPLWLSTPFGGRGHPYTRPYAFEGHPTQFMGYMTMANIPLDYEIQTQDRVLKVKDIINDAKMSVKEGPEVTWTLWAVSHYEEPNAQWTNALGEPWSIERMVQIQVAEPVTSGACGGTHGLFALAYSRNIFLSIPGNTLRGVWLESDQKIKKQILVSQAYQNADGSLSANYFQGPGYSQDFVKRITTSGHQLEWLMVAMPQSRLKETWIRNAIQCVAQDLIDNRRTPSDCGPMYHAVNALTIYRQRMVKGYMVPLRNSPKKIADRNFKGQIIPQQTPIQATRPIDNPFENKHEKRRRF